MVADIMNHPAAVAASNLFRTALQETIKLAQAISGAAKGLAGVVSEGLKDMVASVAPSPTSIPGVAAGPPGAGRGV